jgi:hypothetical protein
VKQRYNILKREILARQLQEKRVSDLNKSLKDKLKEFQLQNIENVKLAQGEISSLRAALETVSTGEKQAQGQLIELVTEKQRVEQRLRKLQEVQTNNERTVSALKRQCELMKAECDKKENMLKKRDEEEARVEAIIDRNAHYYILKRFFCKFRYGSLNVMKSENKIWKKTEAHFSKRLLIVMVRRWKLYLYKGREMRALEGIARILRVKFLARKCLKVWKNTALSSSSRVSTLKMKASRYCSFRIWRYVFNRWILYKSMALRKKRILELARIHLYKSLRRKHFQLWKTSSWNLKAEREAENKADRFYKRSALKLFHSNILRIRRNGEILNTIVDRFRTRTLLKCIKLWKVEVALLLSLDRNSASLILNINQRVQRKIWNCWISYMDRVMHSVFPSYSLTTK